jgi:hypothetical protein
VWVWELGGHGGEATITGGVLEVCMCTTNKNVWVCLGFTEPERRHLERPSLVHPSAYWSSARECPWHWCVHGGLISG